MSLEWAKVGESEYCKGKTRVEYWPVEKYAPYGPDGKQAKGWHVRRQVVDECGLIGWRTVKVSRTLAGGKKWVKETY